MEDLSKPDKLDAPTRMSSNGYSAYLKAIEYIESFLPASGSERWRILLSRFGNPHEKFRSIHVAGTSGKGSVAMMIGEVLRTSGYHAGVHVKPYLQSATESIVVDGRYVSCEEYARLVGEAKPIVDRVTPEEYSRYGPVTWSEVTKLLPLLSFAEQKVDFGVVEAGVGGREDLTNVLRPEVSVITSVGMDHAELLGGTIDVIAHQKAGIIKQGMPAVTAVRQKVALGVISAEAESKGSRLSVLGRDFRVRVRKVGLGGTELDYRSPFRRLEKVTVGMVGRHQAINAAVAIATVDQMREKAGRVDEAGIRMGLAGARVPGRFEVVQEDPVVVLDVAHNVQKVGVLMSVINDVFGDAKVTFVVGFLEGKDARRMIRILGRKARNIIFTNPTVRGKKPIEPELLGRLAKGLTKSSLRVEPDPMSATDEAMAFAGGRGIVCVTGSLYLVGGVRERWFGRRAVAEGRTSYPGR